MSAIYKRELIFLVTGIVTIVMILDYFFVFSQLQNLATQLRTWALIIQLMAIGLGAIHLLRGHYRNIQRRSKMWMYSAWFMMVFALAFALSLMKVFQGGQEYWLYTWLFKYPYQNLFSALYGMIGFYIFSAAYRAFRARNLDATMLLIAGIFVMLANATIGEVITPWFPIIGNWLKETGQIPGMRTFTIVSAFGLLAYGLRALLGKEKGFYSEGIR
jgi:hypothetical protein